MAMWHVIYSVAALSCCGGRDCRESLNSWRGGRVLDPPARAAWHVRALSRNRNKTQWANSFKTLVLISAASYFNARVFAGSR